MAKWTLFAALFSALFWGETFAQGFVSKHYDAENGLPVEYIYTLVQDDRGFLYLGTGSGLVRFDGAKFKTLTTADGLADDFITACHKDKTGLIWLGHEGRVSMLTGSKLSALPDTSSIRSRVIAIASDSYGDVWCASQRNGIFLIDSTKVLKNESNGISEDMMVHSMAIGKVRGVEYMLIGTDQGLLVYILKKRGAPQFAYAATKVPATKIQCIVKKASLDGFWIGTEDEGMLAFEPSQLDTSTVAFKYDATIGFPESNVMSISEGPNRSLWVGSGSQGFFKFWNGPATSSPKTNGLIQVMKSQPSDSIPVQIVKAIYHDNFGNTWLGTYGNGLFSLENQTLSTLRLMEDSTSNLELLCTFEGHGGDFWVGTNRGLYLLGSELVKTSNFKYSLGGIITLPHKLHYTEADGLPSSKITCVLEDKQRNLWVGTRDAGIAVLLNGATKFEARSLSDLSLSNNINALAQGKDNLLWIATTDGAFSLDPATGKTNYYGTQNKLPHNNIYDIFSDKSGKIWFATHTNRLAFFDGKNIETREVTDHGEIPNITCIKQDKQGIFWLGTDGMGLYRFDGEKYKQFNKLDGLQSNYVYNLVIDHYGHVWTTHRDGFSRFVPQTGKILTYPSKIYVSKEENPPSSANIDDYGNIWFSTEQGILRYNWDPERNIGAAPRIFLESVTIFDSLYPITEEIVLPYDSYRITFGYLGLTFVNQEDVLYQYKLEGREPDWSPLTKLDQISFQALEDGQYTFHVRACNRFGKCNEASAKIRIVILPPFWKTWWFRGLIFLAVGGIVFAYIRYRIYRLNREKAELEEKVKQRTLELLVEKEKVEKANIELEKLSLVASETDNAVFILDAEGNLTWVNEGFTRLTGLTMDELLAIRNEPEFLNTSSNPRIKDLLSKATKENRSVQYESTLPSKSGTEIWVVSTLTPIFDQDGNIRNIVIIDSNITDRKIAEEKIRQMNAELESQVAARTQELADANESLLIENQEHIKTSEQLKRTNSELDTFVYRASHDLKGPLASLNGLINIAGMELTDNAVATRYLGLMDKAAKRLDGILIDLIEATQVKQRTIELGSIPALVLANTVVEGIKTQQDLSNVEIKLDIDPSLEIVSDETLLNSILQNLIVTSLRYRDPAKPVCELALSIKKLPSTWSITMTDNGLGYNDDVKHRVWDMFFKANNQISGSGLGLYIVKQATEKLNGQVSMETKALEGTKIHLEFPIQTPA
ncbi:MAG: PAS domain S-box protein [Bacteroidetes bacterium]|nr:PAS domain S-box protein [Bacteroidota bacterium]